MIPDCGTCLDIPSTNSDKQNYNDLYAKIHFQTSENTLKVFDKKPRRYLFYHQKVFFFFDNFMFYNFSLMYIFYINNLVPSSLKEFDNNWNNLPINIRQCPTLEQFKLHLKIWLKMRQVCDHRIFLYLEILT